MDCRRCGRKLTAQASIERGFGPRCHKLNEFERALAEFKPFQIEKAIELIDEGAIQPSLRRPGFFTAVSEDGDRTYLLTANACICPAGRKVKPCYHRAAAVALLAA